MFNTLLFVVVCLWKLAFTLEQHDFDEMCQFTKYDTFRGDVRNILFEENNCEPIRIWIFQRHGTRSPSPHENNEMKQLLEITDPVLHFYKHENRSLSDGQKTNIRRWTLSNPKPSKLLKIGREEIIKISQRFKERFSILFNSTYSRAHFHFTPSGELRTRQTLKAYAEGLFGIETATLIDKGLGNGLNLEESLISRPYNGACPKLHDHRYDMTTLTEQFEEFSKTKDFMEALEKTSRCLGFEENLSPTILSAMFKACAFDQATSNNSHSLSPWCVALGIEGHKIENYHQDLQFYYKDGPDYEVTRRGGCGAVKDLWERFASAAGDIDVDNKSEPVVIIFSHDHAIALIHTALGLLRESTPFTVAAYREKVDRVWNMSKIVPFSANIAAVLHKCESHSGGVEHKVLMLRNEHRWDDIPFCPGGICSWESFRNLTKPVADRCIFEEYC